jgi:nicotinamide-nucleotide amidase
MRAIVISIGSELALGQTVDTNAAWLSSRLAESGVMVVEHVTIADEMLPIVRAFQRACADTELVLVTGGLGPTDDDLTRQALADAMNVPLQRHPELLQQIESYFRRRDRRMPEANKIQADFPKGSEPIENSCGTAPGIHARLGRADVFAMPGVPREMRAMYEQAVLPFVQAKARSGALISKTLLTYGWGESDVSERITDLMIRGQNPSVGTTAQDAIIGVRIWAQGRDRAHAQMLLDGTAAEVRKRLGAIVFGEDEDTLQGVVGEILKQQGRTVVTAESCTGGLIAKSLTDIPGSSAYFLQGYVTYSNQAKTQLLDVPAELIESRGAVSREVAEHMAIGCRAASGADYAISITGIAGPGGGTAEKPVGLVYIGLADADGCEVTERRMGDYLTRSEIRDRTRKAALNLLRLKLMS